MVVSNKFIMNKRWRGLTHHFQLSLIPFVNFPPIQKACHVERLFEVAGRERCHVVVFDDFTTEPGRVYQQLLEFIGVDDDGRREFKAKRSNAGFTSRRLQQFAMNPPAWVFRLIDFSDDATLKRLKKVRKRVKRFNRVREKRRPLSEDMRATLREYYRSDVEKLSELLSRDLTDWTRA